MSNRSTLENFLTDISHFCNSRESRSDFAIRFIEAIESLDDIPFSVIDEARDWQYKIETEGYVDQERYEKLNSALLSELSQWIKDLLRVF
ncbi:MAG: hypothetical protein ACI8O8_000338 [Oleiphilaceae bacterium]|jgi:hypothetical protein